MFYFIVFAYSRIIVKYIQAEIVKGGIMNYLQMTKALQIEIYKSIGYNVNLCIYEKEKVKKKTYD